MAVSWVPRFCAHKTCGVEVRGENLWGVTGRVMGVNDNSWAAALETEEEQTKEGALRSGHLRSW